MPVKACNRHMAAGFSSSRRSHWIAVSGILLFTGLIFPPWLHVSAKDTNPGRMISGIVSDGKAPIPGAIVRIQTTEYSTTTGPHGDFTLAMPESLSSPVKFTAWADGFFIGGPFQTTSDNNNITIILHRHSPLDNSEYEFQSAVAGKKKGCSECHLRNKTAPGPDLPVNEWLRDAHSQSAVNPRFLTMHAGTDMSGRRSPSTIYRRLSDFSLAALPPDPKEPYYGPGYRLDNPDHFGNCAACHVPAAAVHTPLHTSPLGIQGVETEGVTCDFCHKIWDVLVDSKTGLPFPDKPGVLSYEFRRPFQGHQFFTGPLDDIAPGEDVYSRLQKDSLFCAPCHFGVFGDTVVYDSFGEWLRSPYSRKESEKTCQDCHMPHSGAEYFASTKKGGLKRDPKTIVSHKMPGAGDADLLRNAVSLTVSADRLPEGIRVKTKLVNDRTGHHIPTDSPLRHLMLVVQAYGSAGSKLSLKTGPVLPEWCGAGDPANGCYAGLPGKAYARVLEELWTGVSPTGAYWNPTKVVADTRLAAFASDRNEFLFTAPDSGDVRIEATLIYRRAYKKLMEQKGWTDPDIIMNSAVISLPRKR